MVYWVAVMVQFCVEVPGKAAPKIRFVPWIAQMPASLEYGEPKPRVPEKVDPSDIVTTIWENCVPTGVSEFIDGAGGLKLRIGVGVGVGQGGNFP